MDLEQLRQLVAVGQTGTMSAAAKATNITQPSLSRSMRRLETELGYELFDRTRNSASLNEAGKVAFEHARDVLAAEQRMRDALDELARKSRTLRVAAAAPAPVWNLTARIIERFPDAVLETELLPEPEIERRLFNHMADLAVTRKPLALPNLSCIPLMAENLFLHAPIGHPLASREKVSFADMANETFLVFEQIGFWDGVYRAAIPGVQAIVQRDREVFMQLVRSSNLLCFTTDAPQNAGEVPGRVRVPISDASAHATFYIVTLKEAPERVCEIADWMKRNAG